VVRAVRSETEHRPGGNCATTGGLLASGRDDPSTLTPRIPLWNQAAAPSTAVIISGEGYSSSSGISTMSTFRCRKRRRLEVAGPGWEENETLMLGATRQGAGPFCIHLRGGTCGDEADPSPPRPRPGATGSSDKGKGFPFPSPKSRRQREHVDHRVCYR